MAEERTLRVDEEKTARWVRERRIVVLAMIRGRHRFSKCHEKEGAPQCCHWRSSHKSAELLADIE